ncbi:MULTISPECIES: hypothetical protein [Arthrobacter]|uniref:Uncharacterized protein n=1 Tax=Arthrobacter terricola TaxID=2547396 RepID=A0A4R5KQL7_9MICC|nr:MULTISPECIES: hypothetical protein [Arthrobacter]MBT8160735.1 hypothetical protein [Arthrobacter sp. GN70]TDF97886.1 hypothetical protein E1809_07725 [Arthrobacter terricola]
MTFETADSVTLKIWDRANAHHTLDALVHDFSLRHNTSKASIDVTYAGPNTYTVSLSGSTAKAAAFDTHSL